MFAGYSIKLFLSIFLLTGTLVYAQESNIKSLQERVTENSKLLNNSPGQAFSEIDTLLEEAVKTKDSQSELILLRQRCWYYYYITDIENLIRSAQILQKKAIEYRNSRFEANAHLYLLSAYEINQLYDKAISEFDKAMILLEKEDGTDPEIIRLKSNAYSYLSNLYHSK